MNPMRLCCAHALTSCTPPPLMRTSHTTVNDSTESGPSENPMTTTTPVVDVTEQKRLNEAREQGIPWKKWGPYLSERQWGTVREDYSRDGNAWNYFTHDQSRSRAYRW